MSAFLWKFALTFLVNASGSAGRALQNRMRAAGTPKVNALTAYFQAFSEHTKP